ncbi:dinitrogenase iron-molybdenum cofactor [Sulfurimonas sediminis]|uniref:Dinitrogenase iron-molybdenum cofactor n=1 Tax=Sulfurimonas sediminis TaxID=2590020 RepID=A0A7M1B0Y4_9BACT|nr:NifB/NifX family molybdenum-iron cluster-binding protein [Sulfurimonas sediminis]QOP43409.1 dinitrogenase iron-molybdenum cofactor [Sulfurimonas sediminis]
MKIVLAVDEDKKTIVKRTGQSAYFAIYNDDKLEGFVANKHHDGGHHAHREHEEHDHSKMGHEAHTNSHRKDVEALKDCDIILVQAVGENMKEALESIGLKVKKIRQKHGKTADEVVKNFLSGAI